MKGNKIERIDDDKIKLIRHSEIIMDNQQVYNEYGKMKVELSRLQQQRKNAKDQYDLLGQQIANLEKALEDFEPHAKEAEKFLDREKQIKEAKEGELNGS